MINLIIENEGNINTINISKNNNILARDKTQVFNLYKSFEDIVNNLDDISISIDNKKLNKKNINIINLTDFTYVYDNLLYKKGSLLYNYIESIYDNQDMDLLDDINNVIEENIKFINTTNNLNINIEIDNDLFKILNNNFKIKSNIKNDNYLNETKKLLNELIQRNFTTTYIVFYDSDFIDFDFNKYENVYCFNVSTNNDIENYNLLSVTELKEFNLDILIDALKREWPVVYDEKELRVNLIIYFQQCFKFTEFKTNNIYILIISKIMSKLYQFNQNVLYDSDKINNNIKSFLTS